MIKTPFHAFALLFFCILVCVFAATLKLILLMHHIVLNDQTNLTPPPLELWTLRSLSWLLIAFYCVIYRSVAPFTALAPIGCFSIRGHKPNFYFQKGDINQLQNDSFTADRAPMIGSLQGLSGRDDSRRGCVNESNYLF